MSFGISPLDFGINAHALLHSETDVGGNGTEEPAETNLDENTTSQNCDDHQCPEGKNVMTSTNADGTVECSCFDSGKAVRAVGYGLGAVAVVGLLTTGLIVYGVVKVAGKIFGN
jgi:hypothetical protein|tara:strand:+ start:2645 stop:2986 length:342 start_codon:yes stop_codon:yes gene_type:complete